MLICVAAFCGCATTTTLAPTTIAGGDCDSRAIPLFLNGEVNGYASSSQLHNVYCLYVAPGTPGITITLTGMDDDIDLYVFPTYGDVGSTNEIAHSINLDTMPESVYIKNPGGYYYIDVWNLFGYDSHFTLLASVGG